MINVFRVGGFKNSICDLLTRIEEHIFKGNSFCCFKEVRIFLSIFKGVEIMLTNI